MKKVINILIGLVAIVAYIQIRIVKAPILSLGLPNLKTWVSEKEMVQKDVMLVLSFWANLSIFLLFGWFWLFMFIAFEAFILLTLLIIFIVRNTQALKN